MRLGIDYEVFEKLRRTPSTILRMVPLPQEGGLKTDQNKELLCLSCCFEGSLLRELARQSRD